MSTALQSRMYLRSERIDALRELRETALGAQCQSPPPAPRRDGSWRRSRGAVAIPVEFDNIESLLVDRVANGALDGADLAVDVRVMKSSRSAAVRR